MLHGQNSTTVATEDDSAALSDPEAGAGSDDDDFSYTYDYPSKSDINYLRTF
jgi:hypothetical protein